MWLLGRCLFLLRYVLVSAAWLLFSVACVVRESSPRSRWLRSRAFWRSGFRSFPVSGFDLRPALSLSDMFWGASGRGAIWCPEISRRRIDPP